MKTDKIKELVDSSELPQLQKNVLNGFIHRAEIAQDKEQEDRRLIEEVANTKHISEVILSTDEVKIYTIFGGRDDWDTKYPFRLIYLTKEGVWSRCITVSPNLDIAFLNYLQYKYLGFNNQFAAFALKMLEISTDF